MDFGETKWFSANLFPVVQAIVQHDRAHKIICQVINVTGSLHGVMKKANLIKNESSVNFYNNSIPCENFDDVTRFEEHLSAKFFTRKELPQMSDKLKSCIKRNLLEIFVNGLEHGASSRIYVGGQYYHTMKKLDYTILDIGKTIRDNVCSFLNKDVSGKDAIQWAAEEGHTTRTGLISGGLGLKLLQDFLKLNKGKLQIISDNGLWTQEECGTVSTLDFNSPFPGTIVNLEINIDDSSAYRLKEEK